MTHAINNGRKEGTVNLTGTNRPSLAALQTMQFTHVLRLAVVMAFVAPACAFPAAVHFDVMAANDNSFAPSPNPISAYCTGLPRFVTVTGGGYFFMPGIRALRFLSELTP